MGIDVIIKGYNNKFGKTFEERTREALGLIEKHDSVNFKRVKKYLREIRQYRVSSVDLEHGIFKVGTPTWRHQDVEWYASCIVHDTIHLMLQHRFGFDWDLPENQERHEAISLRAQARSLKRINETHPSIEYLMECSLKPVHHLKQDRDW